MELTKNEFDVIRGLVRERAGIVLEEGKEYLVESRMAALLRSSSIASMAELMTDLGKKSKQTEELVVDALTTNETSFFRDGKPWDLLRECILPELIERCRERRAIKIWCAASSSGQEPTSLALLMRDNFPEIASWDVRILATDISEDMLERCRSGIYSQLEVSRGLPSSMLVRYFEKEGVKWKVAPAVRKLIEYRYLNLMEPIPSMPAVDLVMIRNVLIYFDEETKIGILQRIQGVLRPDGYLMLGTAETARSAPFERVKHEKSSYYRVAA
ncbi:MAG: chemotaxis protein methyltransferase CheR [Planctomycetota bacterium]|jgi:chemotaxis protein methyltransferase CheR